eukprot:577205-Amphidinium_carterae.1
MTALDILDKLKEIAVLSHMNQTCAFHVPSVLSRPTNGVQKKYRRRKPKQMYLRMIVKATY